MATPKPDPYDEFLYENYSYPQSHVNSLATLATLMGMTPAPVNNCRVLELACGDGSNILPMAYGLPGSRFLGIDRAAKPIATGLAIVDALGLRNLELRRLDLMDVTAEIGEFDYIIAHGLYSWVPAAVRDRVLQLCRSNLAPQGIAYVSYNVYPGYHLFEIARDLMLFHTRECSKPQEKVAQSRSFANWLAAAQTKTSAYALYVKEMADQLSRYGEGAIYHDVLAEINEPVYFHQFIRHATEHGLQFLSEAEHSNIREFAYPPEAAKQLHMLGEQSILTKEQYLDFLGGRSFRQTLLCHHEVEIDRAFDPKRIRNFFIASPALPTSPKVDFASLEPERFRAFEDASAATNLPLAKAALFYLGQIYPRAERFDDLVVEANRILGPGAPQDDQAREKASETLAELLLRTYGVGVIELYLHAPRFADSPGERPLASPLARLQAQRGPLVSSLLGSNVRFDDPLGRQFLLLLDGTRDRKALMRDFRALIEATFATNEPDITSNKEGLLRELPERLDERLRDLARRGFLLE